MKKYTGNLINKVMGNKIMLSMAITATKSTSKIKFWDFLISTSNGVAYARDKTGHFPV